MDVLPTITSPWIRDAAVLVGGISLSYYLKQRAFKRQLPLPPSPKGWPFLGNALDIPLENIAQGYAKWGRELDSDIVSATALGKVVVVVNTIDKTLDLLDKRSTVYSSRFQSTMAGELTGFDYPFVLLPYDDRWKERRRMFVQNFRPADTFIVHPQAREFAHRFLVDLKHDPGDFLEVIKGTIGAFIMSLSYGIPVKRRGDPHLDFSEFTNKTLGDIIVPGGNPIDVFPVLKYLPTWAPGAWHNRKAKELLYMSEQLRSAPFDEAVSKLGTGEAQPSFVSIALGALEDTGENVEYQKQIIKDTAAMFYMAGTDTIVGTILNWIWVLLKNPEVQARVHAELDAVLKGRMPEFGDEEQLPYLMATLMESARWAPVTPIGVPHLNTEDDVYDGYFIPKDSIVIPNMWAMLRNDKDYTNGTTYNPSRFLTADGQLDKEVRDPFTITFGFGRRACPGAHIGRGMTWLVAASLARLFEWREPLGDDGRHIDQPMDFEPNMIYQPKPFKCDFKIRSADAQALYSSLEGEIS